MDPNAIRLKDPGTCRIFFSSPFGGMEEEREELTKKYFPQIHHACDAKGIKFVPVDMRWGITKEAADNAQVMNICLREVERSDFFVGFFGQRYGWHSAHQQNDSVLLQNFENAHGTYPWVDEFKDRSMTEIECRAGHLNNPGLMPACFSFRDKAYDDLMGEQAQKNNDLNTVMKFTVENEFADKMMKNLIQEVVNSKDKTWGVQLDYKNPQEMAKFIFDTIWTFLTEVFLKESNKEEIPFLIEQRLVHDQFIKSASRIYCGCESYCEKLVQKIDGSSSKGTIVTGPAGCGKSALLANWLLALRQSHPHVVQIYHFIGCAPGTERSRTILERILLELQNVLPKLYSKNSSQEDCCNNKSESSNISGDNKNSVDINENEKTDSQLKREDGKREIHNEKNEKNSKEVEKKDEEKSGLEKKTTHQILSEVMMTMKEISEKGHKVVIVLDALNQQNSMDKTIKHLYWLPESFPDGITFICSTLDSDTASHDLLVTQRGIDTLVIDSFNSELQKSICVETLNVCGKELSPHQLERVINSKETSNALFLKLVLYELSIYGNFNKLDEKIDSLIYVSGVNKLLQVILDRLELDYNSADYQSNLVKDVSRHKIYLPYPITGIAT